MPLKSQSLKKIKANVAQAELVPNCTTVTSLI